MKPKRSRRPKLLAAVPALAGLAAVPASGMIVYTPVNGGAGQTISYGPLVGIFFSPDLQQISPTYFSGAELLLTFHLSSLVPYSYPNPNADGATAVSGHYAAKLDAGTEIGYSLIFRTGPRPLYYYTAGPWSPGTRDYLGFGFFIGSNLQANFAWADVSYNSDNSLTLYGFAYETTLGANITAGAVPEPAESAAFAALLAGSAAAYAARKKRLLRPAI
jgi:hypothetical protein